MYPWWWELIMAIDNNNNQAEKTIALRGARAAFDTYFVELNENVLCDYFDLNNNPNAKRNAPFLIEGNAFTKPFYNLLHDKRKRKIDLIIGALKKIDPERYKGFIGTPD